MAYDLAILRVLRQGNMSPSLILGPEGPKEERTDDSSPEEQPVERDLFVPFAVLIALIGYTITAILAILGC